MIASVIVDILHSNVDRIFEYKINENIEVNVGDRVKIPFANRIIDGFVIKIDEQSVYDSDKLKEIISVCDEQAMLSQEMIQLMWYMRDLYHVPLSSIIRLMVPGQLRSHNVKEKYETYLKLAVDCTEYKLTDKQSQIIDYFTQNNTSHKKSEIERVFSKSIVKALLEKGLLEKVLVKVERTPYQNLQPDPSTVELTYYQKKAVRQIASGQSKTYLLHGVTGSGKTEVYLNVIKKCVESGKNAILLVPEIALTPQMLKNFRSRFGSNVALLHSGLSDGERYDEWRRLKNGQAKIAIGARSAIFAPIENIAVIIIDEEHEQSYLSESSPKYSAKEVALFRMKYNSCPLVLASATPDIQSYYKAECGEYTLIELKERVNNKPLPNIQTVDMRKELLQGNKSIFSQFLKQKIQQCLDNKEQVMLYINRRGFSTKLICSSCGYVAKCADCDVSLTYHSDENVLKCHYCNNKYKPPEQCPKCKSKFIKYLGAGTQKVEDELKKLFPSVKVLRLDNDTVNKKDGHLHILNKFADGEADILVGTQMIAKGHDFRNVTLVGIIDADLSLFFADYRCVERTFQLITQVSGRAGRADLEGSVVLQTFNPDHYIFKMIKEYDYESFYEKEIALREVCSFPPFCDFVRVISSSESNEKAIGVIKKNYEDILKLKEENQNEFVFFGKMKCPIYKIQSKYRYQLLMRILPNNKKLIDKIFEITEKNKENCVNSYVEVNASSMN